MKLTSTLLFLLLGVSLTAQESPNKTTPAASPADELLEGPSRKGEPRVAKVSSIAPDELEGFEHYAPQIQQLIRSALDLTKLNLTYAFGSSNPKQGGMDCSGTIYHLLHEFGSKEVPRQSNEMAGWVKDKTLLHRTTNADSLKHPDFYALRPGDLLFWSGTYRTAPRSIPVTHVMLYLGKLKGSGRHVMFGASDGRSYQGERRTGVSVFDLSLPKASSESSFYGYGMIPGAGRIKPEVSPSPPVVETASTTMPVPAVAETRTAHVEKEVIRPAVVASAPQKKVTQPKPMTAQIRNSPPKPSHTVSKTTRPAAKKPSPPPPTPQEQIGKAVKKVADSVRDWIKS